MSSDIPPKKKPVSLVWLIPAFAALFYIDSSSPLIILPVAAIIFIMISGEGR